MATIDYEKKIREYLSSSEVDQLYKSMLSNLFPELKESEDEKTKRVLHSIANKMSQHLCYIFTEEEFQCFDAWSNVWLENQGEHKKFRDSIQVGDKVTRNEDGVLVNLSQLNRVAKKDEKQGEQKHQYISRPRYIGEEELLGTNKQGKCPFLKQELIDMGFAFTQDGDLAYPIHKIEKKEFAAWSEEDERMLNGIIEASTHHCYLNITDIDWLKSLKDRVQPQPKYEWSKEDKVMLDEIIDFFENGTVKLQHDLSLYASWLKSLKDRYTWKPSEEQMVALKEACDEHWEPDGLDSLYTLYQELKKLREK